MPINVDFKQPSTSVRLISKKPATTTQLDPAGVIDILGENPDLLQINDGAGPSKRKSNEALASKSKKIFIEDNSSMDDDYFNDIIIDSSFNEPIPSNIQSTSILNKAITDNVEVGCDDFDDDMFEAIDFQYFKTQFTQKQNNDVEQNLSQFFEQTQFDQILNRLPERVAPNKLNLTQIFNDDMDENSFTTTEPRIETANLQSSQLFLKQIKDTIVVGHNDVSTAITDQCKVFKSNNNASVYIQLQRTMQGENEDNLNDDNFLDSDLSQAYKSSQYRREIEAEFDQCERSICNIDGFREQLEVDDALCGIEEINWTTNFVEHSPIRVNEARNDAKPSVLTTPTSIIRQRLSEMPRKVLHQKQCDTSNQITSTLNFVPKPAVMAASSSKFCLMGPFFGLPNKIKKLIKDFKGISELYDWQKECLTLPAINLRSNLIYALPTSGGKTLVAEILILREIICRRKNCIFILPYVSIVQEKLWALSPFAVQLDFLLEEYAAGKGCLPPRKRRKKKSVYIATIEKGLALLDSLIEADRANEIGLIVIDELHIIGEGGRGAVLETLLTKALFIKAGIQIVGMSATIGNINEIAQFLSADVYTRDFRPVELKEFIKCGTDILEINTNNRTDDRFSFVRKVDYGYREEVLKRDPDHLAGLVSEIIPDSSCLIFCPSKLNCENVALLLSQLLSKKYCDHKIDEKNALKSAIEADAGPLCSILSKTIPFGIAYHHSGLTLDERRHLEDAFRRNVISIICCTSTLAAGVNLPAKRVILRSPYIGRDFITLSKYKQMAGRAGRAGMGDECGESIIICSQRDNFRVASLLSAPMDEAASSMHLDDEKGLRNLILSCIGLGLASCQKDLQQLVSTTLMAVQANRLDINPAELTDKIIASLFKVKALSVANQLNTSMNSSTAIEIVSQDSPRDTPTMADGICVPSTSKQSNKQRTKLNVILKPSTQLEISKLGKASFKSCIDLGRAQIIYKDLVQAQNSLVLLDYLHLLYIVTPYEPIDINVHLDMGIYYAKYVKLDAKHLHTAKILGINESCAMKMISGKTIKPELSRTVNRFFLTLVLHELWSQRPIHEVAETFHINRGVIQNLMAASASYASAILKFCEELDEFWAFKELLSVLSKRLSYCCSIELLPLMDLPCVKLARAKQLYAAGYKSLESVAKATARELVADIEHLNERVARQLIAAAKVLLLEKVETLREEVQDCLEVLERR